MLFYYVRNLSIADSLQNRRDGYISRILNFVDRHAREVGSGEKGNETGRREDGRREVRRKKLRQRKEIGEEERRGERKINK